METLELIRDSSDSHTWNEKDCIQNYSDDSNPIFHLRSHSFTAAGPMSFLWEGTQAPGWGTPVQAGGTLVLGRGLTPG